MTKLYVMAGPDKGKSFDFAGGATSVGRSSASDIQIEDKAVSRRHLEIIRREKKYFIRDLDSKNGTFVNEKRINPGSEVEFDEGFPIAFGRTVICLGEVCSMGEDELTAMLDSIDLSKELNESDAVMIKDRPMTHKKNLELFFKVSHILNQSLNINEILENVLQDLLDLLKRIDRGLFILVDNKTGELSEPISIIKGSSGDGGEAYSRTIVDRVIKERKPVVILDTRKEDKANLSASMRSMKVKSIMCVPLISRSQIQGVIYIDSFEKPYGFRREDVSLLTALAAPAAIAIENASLHSKKDTQI